MGAGKGDGVDDAAAQQPVVVLRMDLHCSGCAHKVKKAIRRLPGVESIVTDVAAKRVVVAGTADAGALKARIETKTGKPVEIVSAGGGGEKQKADRDGGAGEKSGDKGASVVEEEKGKKQPSEETKSQEVGAQEAMPTASAFGFPQETTTVLLKVRLHCDGCADRIRRRIYKFKGVKDVVVDGHAKDEVKVTGTMDVPALLAYLRDKLDRPVDAVAPGKKDKGGDGGKSKSVVPDTGGDDFKKKSKDKSVDVVGTSTSVSAAAAAFVAPAPAEATTHHVTPPYDYVAYNPQGQGPATSSYYPSYNYGNADGMGYSNSTAATYYHQHQPPPHQQYYHQPQPHQQYFHQDADQRQAYYAPDPSYDMAPPSQVFSDENPNACSVM